MLNLDVLFMLAVALSGLSVFTYVCWLFGAWRLYWLVPRSLYHTLELGCSIEDLDKELEPICRLLDDADIVYEVKMGMNYVPRYKNTRSQSDIVCEKVHFMFLDDADCTAAELIIGEYWIK